MSKSTTPPDNTEQLRIILETYTVGTSMGNVGPGNGKHFQAFVAAIQALIATAAEAARREFAERLKADLASPTEYKKSWPEMISKGVAYRAIDAALTQTNPEGGDK